MIGVGKTCRRATRRKAGRIALQAALARRRRRPVSTAPSSTPRDNLARANIASGFGFWNNTAGFDISQTLIAYSPSVSTFGRAFWVGLLNTLLVAGIGIVLATVLGFTVGIARLSRNWLVARLAGGYVELIRNIPLLLQLLFWYNAVLKALPELRDSVVAAGRRASQQSRPVSAAAAIRAGLRRGGHRLAGRPRGRACCCICGRAAARSAPARSRARSGGRWA